MVVLSALKMTLVPASTVETISTKTLMVSALAVSATAKNVAMELPARNATRDTNFSQLEALASLCPITLAPLMMPPPSNAQNASGDSLLFQLPRLAL